MTTVDPTVCSRVHLNYSLYGDEHTLAVLVFGVEE